MVLGGREHKANQLKKTYFKEDSIKTLQNSKDLKVVFQKTMEDLKQIILKKDEAILNFLIEINKFKCFNMQKMQSQI